MKILDAGHHYELDGYDEGPPQQIRFLKREKEPFNASSYGGTNCQELLRALIDRAKYLQNQKPCAETEAIVGLLSTALMLFETRAARVKERIIEFRDLGDVVRGKTCAECGHIGCSHQQGQEA